MSLTEDQIVMAPALYKTAGGALTRVASVYMTPDASARLQRQATSDAEGKQRVWRRGVGSGSVAHTHTHSHRTARTESLRTLAQISTQPRLYDYVGVKTDARKRAHDH